jgi:arylsulfatase
MWTTTIPHVSLQAPKEWVDYYVHKFGDEKPYLGNAGYGICRYPHATYAAMVSYFDALVASWWAS